MYIENNVNTKYVTLSIVQAHCTSVRALTNIGRKHDTGLSYANMNRLKYTFNGGHSYEFLAIWGHEKIPVADLESRTEEPFCSSGILLLIC